MKKILCVALDGVGDRPSEVLGGKTPLEAAKTPHMDYLTGKGRCGFMLYVKEGFAPETDSATMNLLGYDLSRYYTGRGPVEAYGAGLNVRDGDVCFRINFATADEGTKIIDRRVCRDLSNDEAEEIASEINSRVRLVSVPAEFEVKSIGGYRGVLVLRKIDGTLSGNISNTDPAYEKKGVFSVPVSDYEMKFQECKPLEKSSSAMEAATLVNEFVVKSFDLLNGHEINGRRLREGKPPANLILVRDASHKLPVLPPLQVKHRIRVGMCTESAVERGVALLSNARVFDLGGYSRDHKKDYPRYADKALEALEFVDLLYIHIKGPDEPGHDGNCKLKKSIIEEIDDLFFGNVLDKIELSENIVAVTSDHATPCELRTHSADPVPLVVSGGGIEGDGIKELGEAYLRAGSLKTIHAVELIPLLIKVSSDPDAVGSYLKDSFTIDTASA